MSKAPRKAAKASIKRLKSSDQDKRSEETVEVRQSERQKNMKRTTEANAVDNSAATSSGKGPSTKRVKTAPATPEEDPCPICLDDVINAKKLECGHVFCSLCIDEAFKVRGEICPICGRMFGGLIGNQPVGFMSHRVIAHHLPGFHKCNTIEISYHFENGIQGTNHPNPGKPYTGTSRVAYLPDNPEGNRVLQLLRQAFDAGLTFTIGTSATTGVSNTVIWNDIHHKTVFSGGSFGYPDPTYLSRVTEELAAKGIK